MNGTKVGRGAGGKRGRIILVSGEGGKDRERWGRGEARGMRRRVGGMGGKGWIMGC